jgi:predicted DNA-binding antitoxin AbrB/MazE fold protein
MNTVIKAVYEDGVFKPKEPVHLKERAEVDVILPFEPDLDEDDPTAWKAIDSVIGSVSSGVSDVSEKHDECLYGDPRD